MALRYLEDAGYSLGMIRDLPSWQIPTGGVYDQQNMLNDLPGIARQRGGSTALVSGSQTAFCTSLGFVYSEDATPIEELYGLDGKAGVMYSINKTSGAATSIKTALATNMTVGRPVRHFGFTVFPSNSSTLNAHYVAGETVSTTFQSTVGSNLAAGNPQITLTGADVTTNVKVGALVRTVGTANPGYIGRVVSVDTTKLFSVWPVPTITAALIGGDLATEAVVVWDGGKCAASFQNRLLFGNAYDQTALSTTAKFSRADRRVIYSPLPTETAFITGTATTVTGATFVNSQTWQLLNWFEVPGSDPIVAMEPIDDNRLLILTSTHPVVFSGNLTTQLATTSPSITFDLSDLNVPAGCLSDLSVQRTSRGIVWAGPGGVYALAGNTIKNLCGDDSTKRIASYWRSLASDATFVIHGSAYVRDHYFVSGTSGGTTFSLMCNMANLQWTRLSGVGTDLFFGVARPSTPTQVFGARWWDQTGAAPSFTNGQTLRLDSMLAPYTAGATKTDADGTAVAVSLTTRTITGDAETQKIFQRGTVRHQQSSTTAAMTVTAKSVLDAAETNANATRTLGSLSNTALLTVSNATNANPIVVTTGTHGLQTDDFVDIDGVTGNTNANGRWRITVTGTTTFSLVGGIGNGAFGGTPTCKKLTETDYLMSPLNAGQGASVKITGSPNNFELHGIRLAVLEKQQVMSA